MHQVHLESLSSWILQWQNTSSRGTFLSLKVFIQNRYPHKTVSVWRILYHESRENSTEKEKINLNQAFYVPFHSPGKRLVKILKYQFGISTIFKKTQSLGDILLKKSRQITKEFKRNSIYKIPCAEYPRNSWDKLQHHSRREQLNTFDGVRRKINKRFWNPWRKMME